MLKRIHVALTLTVAVMIVAAGASKAFAERLPIRTYTTNTESNLDLYGDCYTWAED